MPSRFIQGLMRSVRTTTAPTAQKDTNTSSKISQSADAEEDLASVLRGLMPKYAQSGGKSG